MAAYDNVSLPGAPAAPSYAAPIVDFSPLGQIGDAYYKGQEQQRQQKIRNAFAEGLPKDSSGQPDYNAMAAKLFQLGDFGNASNVLKTGYALKSLDAPVEPSPFGGGPSAPPVSPSQPASAAQPSLPQRVPNASPTGYSGGDNGQTTVASVVQTAIPDANTAGPLIPRIAASLGVDPNQPLDPAKMDQVKAALGRITGGQVAQAAPQAAPQASTAPTSAPAQASNPAVDALVPPQFRGRAREYADMLQDAANRLRQQAQRQGLLGLNTKALEDRASQYDAVANKVRDALAPTTEQKDLASGTTRNKAITESDVKLGQAEYAGIGAAARQYVTATKPYVQLSKSILNQPETYTGIGADGVATLNKLKAIYGDTKGAQYYEALQKVTAASVLGTINTQKFEAQEAGANSGRIFAQQVDLVSKSTLSTDNSLAGNRFLVGVQERLGDFSEEMARMAAKYKKAHGTLDAGFDEEVSAYLTKNPIFTPLEQQHPNLIGAPTSPFDDVKRTSAWAKRMGLSKGEPIRTPSGRYVAVP